MKIKNLFLLIAGTAILLSSCDQKKSSDQKLSSDHKMFSDQKMTDNTKLESDIDSVSYMIGVDIGNNLNNASLEEINYSNFINGIADAFEKKDLKIDEKEIKPYIQKFFKELQAKQTEISNAKGIENLKKGIAFLEENKKKEGVITTESGLQYEIIKEGAGNSPTETDTIICHYHGTTLDGDVFDSSIDKGEKFKTALNRVLPGWVEGITLMKEGAKYKFYIPTGLAYGTRVRPGGVIEQNMALIFEVELFEVRTSEQKAN
ncbi:MAG: FKBP-type peptidyl-prolyl cis-trans isomerase [Bacteroidales bacterium]|nr:FKBP-type peptidyl-prolyl cis-trans isomerase [Bacteroidales bacterium]